MHQHICIDGYKIRTGRPVLAMAFERLLPEIRDLIDIPPEMRRAGRRLQDLLAGRWNPKVEEVSLEEQAKIAVPLMNAVRLMAEPHGRRPPKRVREKSIRAAKLMYRMDPAVSWVAIRNSMAYEASNRPSQGEERYNWVAKWFPHMQAVPVWFDVYNRIRRTVLN